MKFKYDGKKVIGDIFANVHQSAVKDNENKSSAKKVVYISKCGS